MNKLLKYPQSEKAKFAAMQLRNKRMALAKSEGKPKKKRK